MVVVRREGFWWHALVAVPIGLLTCTCSLVVDTSDLARDPTSAMPASGDGGAAPRDGAPEGSVAPAAPLGCPGAGRSCVPEAPSGWVGPVFLYDGPPTEKPACPATMAVVRADARRELAEPPPHTCSACSCATGSGQTCTAILDQYATGDCTDAPTSTSLTTLCKKTTGTSASGVKIRLTASGGSCPATGGTPVRPAIQWGASTRACGAPELLKAGCEAGKVCAPDPPGPFRTRHCVTRTGDAACPGAPYEEKIAAYAGLDDGRVCSACTCGPPSDACGGTAHGFDNESCFLFGDSFMLPVTTCRVGTEVSSVRILSAKSVAPTCTSTGGGIPSGGVKPSNQVTVCCAR